ncbi:MAG: 30S ribosomal protein S2 [Ignavibacteria bacterium GWF2_33_9]|nr:MAG: 30S ribosomal protein S2 [Ignavibacteria bacterium GWF2_33_9]
MEHYVSIEALLESGAHFGHLTRRWNPKMSKFIFDEKNGIHIIDLRKTQLLLDFARNAAYELASQGKNILFVGTKPQAKNTIESEAKRAHSNYVSERWLGGMLTNFVTIRKSIKRLNAIDKMEVDGTFDRLTKKEKLLLNRERDRLRKVFGGIEDMNRTPGAIFVVDIKKEHIALKEAKVLGIPIIAMVDTNTNPDLVDFPIPANDDSIRSIELISKNIADAILEGTTLSRARMAELEASSDRIAKENESDEPVKVQRKFRERKHPAKSNIEETKNENNNAEENTEVSAE